MVEADEV